MIRGLHWVSIDFTRRCGAGGGGGEQIGKCVI